MLKISIVETATEQTIILQGRLTEPWVSELMSVWQNAKVSCGERKCIVDLNDTTAIDQDGVNLLEVMCKEGAKFIAKGVLTKYTVKCLMAKIAKSTGLEGAEK
jgi:ABC-type transporter Mla MlaB component